MLTHPDPQKFEEIRARWEAAQPGDAKAAVEMGRKAPPQPAEGDAQETGGSRFRRKLSYGLAFISNPLAQRKTTPGRHGASNAALTVDVPGPMTSDTVTIGSSAARSSTRHGQSAGSPVKGKATASHKDLGTSLARDATTTALSRSHTTSFIPRPVRADSSASIKAPGNITTTQQSAEILSAKPSKIPSPSPPLSVRRRSSPRAYIPLYKSPAQTPNTKLDSHQQLANFSTGDTAVLAIRSQTTPNLVNVIQSPSPAHRISARKSALKKPTTSPSTSQESTLQENVPINQRTTQTRPRIHEASSRRQGLSAPTYVAARKSLGSHTPLRQNKQLNRGSPLTARKQPKSNLGPQTPTTSRVVSSVQPTDTQQSMTTLTSHINAITQPRLLGPLNAPTPTPITVDHVPVVPALPRSNTEEDMQRKDIGKLSGLGGIWRSSRALAAANPEVRLPRSNTFHDFGISNEECPPVPPIPEKYRIPSLSNLSQPLQVHSQIPGQPQQHSNMTSNQALCEPIPEENSDLYEDNPSGAKFQYSFEKRPDDPESHGEAETTTFPSRSTTERPPTNPGTAASHNEIKRPWSLFEQQYANSADVEPYLQVGDYMPPIYWAGRFQSRFDQWRTEALTAQLNPKHRAVGLLAKCKLDQEKLAACYIFAQLRDLCVNDQAADSLWVRNNILIL